MAPGPVYLQLLDVESGETRDITRLGDWEQWVGTVAYGGDEFAVIDYDGRWVLIAPIWVPDASLDAPFLVDTTASTAETIGIDGQGAVGFSLG